MVFAWAKRFFQKSVPKTTDTPNNFYPWHDNAPGILHCIFLYQQFSIRLNKSTEHADRATGGRIGGEVPFFTLKSAGVEIFSCDKSNDNLIVFFSEYRGGGGQGKNFSQGQTPHFQHEVNGGFQELILLPAGLLERAAAQNNLLHNDGETVHVPFLEKGNWKQGQNYDPLSMCR